MEARRVLVAVMLNGSYGRDAAQGIADYALAHARWEIEFDGASNHPLSQARIQRMIREWKPDAIIGQITVGGLPKIVQRARTHTVNISSHGQWKFPQVLPDQYAAGRLAAGYLSERKLRSFAYCGMSGDFKKLDPLGTAFAAELRKLGFECSLYAPSKRALQGVGDIDDLRRWLATLPVPVGILADTDLRGVEIIQACRGMSRRVPDEVAVLGANNDTLLCSLCSPQLSSLIVPAHQVGFDAAKLLDAMMNGQAPPKQPLLIPPSGIAARQSTDILHVADPELAAAVRYIRQHATASINVSDVVENVSVSRRSLERRFMEQFGRTPHDEILRARFDRARTLLTESSLKINEVARSSGFGRHMKFARMFKQHVGLTPSAYRERYSR
jgi:LacI family transcriptional regulator